MAKIILFVDAMEPKEYGEEWIEMELGLIESGSPKVTPKVTSEVYTGASPSANGMGRVHSNKGETPHRPMMPTIMEKLERMGYNVLSLHMPYAFPLNLQNQSFVADTMQGPHPGQNPLAQMCMQPPAVGGLYGEDIDKGLAFNTRLEDIYSKASSMLNAVEAGGFDVVFFGIRSPDQYTHFQWHEDYRTRLLDHLGQEVERWKENHEVLWWSDHGSEEKKDLFLVNKWLMDKGYLDVDIDLDFNNRFKEEFQKRQPQNAQRAQQGIENQLQLQSPGVEIKESSQAASYDPYDSSIDILDDSLDPQELIDDMMDTPYYEKVGLAKDVWGDGQYIDECPGIVTLRTDNVLVSGNIHPEPKGMGHIRTGVHSKYGAWGSTDKSLKSGLKTTPQEFHDIIWEFVTGKKPPRKDFSDIIPQLDIGNDDERGNTTDNRDVMQNLEDMGYV